MAEVRITPQELAELMAGPRGVRVLDVRSGAEYENGHIAGSYNVPLDQLGEHRSELARSSGPVVLVCQSGMRATRAGTSLAEVGMDQLVLLDGGMNAWAAAGLPLNRTKARWTIERQVRLVVGVAVLTAIAASVVWPPARFVAGFFGLGLTFAALTDSCMLGMALARMPHNRSNTCDVGAVAQQFAMAER